MPTTPETAVYSSSDDYSASNSERVHPNGEKVDQLTSLTLKLRRLVTLIFSLKDEWGDDISFFNGGQFSVKEFMKTPLYHAFISDLTGYEEGVLFPDLLTNNHPLFPGEFIKECSKYSLLTRLLVGAILADPHENIIIANNKLSDRYTQVYRLPQDRIMKVFMKTPLQLEVDEYNGLFPSGVSEALKVASDGEGAVKFLGQKVINLKDGLGMAVHFYEDVGKETLNLSSLIEDSFLVGQNKDVDLSNEVIQKNLPPVLRALQRFHNEGLVHLDLKPSNILIDSKGSPFLSDYDAVRGVGVRWPKNLTTPFYACPELIINGAPHLKSDVYSIGKILLNAYGVHGVISDAQEFTVSLACIRGNKSKEEAYNQKFIDQLPENTPDSIRDLIARCIAFNPEDRPDLEEIIQVIDDLGQVSQSDSYENAEGVRLLEELS